MKKGFTLLEILAVVAIIAIMVTASVISVRRGQAGAKVRGATRDIFATIRRARSMALVSQEASIITYSMETDGDEPVVKIDIVTAKMFNDNSVKEAELLGGKDGRVEKVRIAEDDDKDFKGETMEDVLFAPVSSDVVTGVRIKVTKEGEALEGTVDEGRTKPKISVFSNVDYLIGKYKEKKEVKGEGQGGEEAKVKGEGQGGSEAKVKGEGQGGSEVQEPVSVVWEANGRTEPHQVWVYADGQSPDSGLSIKVDRFGGAKVVGTGNEE